MGAPDLSELPYFVARDDAIEEVLHRVRDRGRLWIIDIEGVPGVGKTILLAKLFAEVRATNAPAAWSSMRDYDPRRRGETGQRASNEALVDNLDRYKPLVLALANDLLGESASAFAEELTRVWPPDLVNRRVVVDVGGGSVRGGEIRIDKDAVVHERAKVDAGVHLHESEAVVRDTILAAKTAAAQAFAKHVNAVGQRVVIFVDDFERVVDQEIGHWLLLDLAPRLADCALVLNRAETPLELPGPAASVRYRKLQNFTLVETRACLERRLGRAPLPDELVMRVYEFTTGHPQAVCLAADVAGELGPDNPDVLKAFEGIAVQRSEQLRTLVRTIRDAITEADVKQALECGFVARRFDAKMLAYLMHGVIDAQGEANAKNLIGRLREYSFTESRDEALKFHDFIRREMARELEENDPARYDELQLRAAAYYRACMDEQHERWQAEEPYLRWYCIEDHAWQKLSVEWLYHLARARDRARAQLLFAKAYFDAFWWWGCYLHFPFCDRLVEQWERTQTRSEDQEWLAHLRRFHLGYPNRYEERYDKHGKGNWVQVEDALLALRSMIGIDGDVDALDAEQRHVRAVTELFLAHAARYGARDRDAADDHYAEALALFEKDEDSWNTAWTLYERADLALEHGGTELDTERALELARANEDHELEANLHRLRADAHAARDEREASWRDHAHASFHAYAFQALPKPPDEYTRAFYREIKERILARLVTLWRDGEQAEALADCALLRDFWHLYWRRATATAPTDQAVLLAGGRLAELEAQLFPAEPTDEDLRHGNAYAGRVKTLIRRMEKPARAAAPIPMLLASLLVGGSILIQSFSVYSPAMEPFMARASRDLASAPIAR